MAKKMPEKSALGQLISAKHDRAAKGVGKYLRPFPASPNCGHPLAFVVVAFCVSIVVVIGTVGNSFLANFWILDFSSTVFVCFRFIFISIRTPVADNLQSSELQFVFVFMQSKFLPFPGRKKK